MNDTYPRSREKGNIRMDKKHTILVVDDEKTNLVRAKMLLQNEFNPVLVNSGVQCLKYLQGHIPDLILLDIMMPDMDGWQVMQKIQESEELKNVPVIFLTADSSPETESACFDAGAVDFCVKPIQPISVLSRIRRAIELEGYRRALHHRVMEQTEQITSMKLEFIVGVANLVENRDGTTGEHIKRTSEVVRCLSRELKERGMYPDILTDRYLEQLYAAAPMHDLGKIKISDTILCKPGKLTEEEFNTMKEHTIFGREIIRDIVGTIEDEDFIQIACDVAAYHHEKYNGKGYPEGLAGEDIPLSARIMAVADVYDALKEKRCYKDAFPLEEVYAIMQDDAGSHFDPKLIEVFMDIKDKIEQVG